MAYLLAITSCWKCAHDRRHLVGEQAAPSIRRSPGCLREGSPAKCLMRLARPAGGQGCLPRRFKYGCRAARTTMAQNARRALLIRLSGKIGELKPKRIDRATRTLRSGSAIRDELIERAHYL